MGEGSNFAFAGDKVVKVTLNQDMTASAMLDGKTMKGTWFAFYDQAFKVELENG